jgi:tetratricopeptide (TPR) repeat protein
MKDFKTTKRAVEALIQVRSFDKALEICNAALRDKIYDDAELLRLSAYVHASSGDYESAVCARERIVEKHTPQLRDYFQLGENCVSAGRFSEAAEWLEKTLQKGSQMGETWFDAASLMLLAYAQARTGRSLAARENLQRSIEIDSECRMPLVDGDWATFESVTRDIQHLSSAKN